MAVLFPFSYFLSGLSSSFWPKGIPKLISAFFEFETPKLAIKNYNDP